jgi:hypothetical protein
MTTPDTNETSQTTTMSLDELLALPSSDLFNFIKEKAATTPEHEKTLKALYFAIDEYQTSSTYLVKDFGNAKRHAEEGQQQAASGIRCDAAWLLSDVQRIAEDAAKRQHAADTAKVLFHLLPEGLFSK